MIRELSILIPCHNDLCLPQVKELRRCASAIDGLQYEIIVSDDASTNQEIIQQNAEIEKFENCRLLRQTSNIGRAANRNALVNEAHYEWLLFLDCNIKIPTSDFIKNYLEAAHAEVVNGGVTIEADAQLEKNNLRYQYEKKIGSKHTAAMRQQRPYQSFRTTNFIARKEVMLRHPFDETISRYGYEDVLFGKRLHDDGITIQHIENQVAITHFETNEKYVSKIEEAMHTLHSLRQELDGYSPILYTTKLLDKLKLTSFVKWGFRKTATMMRRKLIGEKPHISWLNPYKLGYYISID